MPGGGIPLGPLNPGWPLGGNIPGGGGPRKPKGCLMPGGGGPLGPKGGPGSLMNGGRPRIRGIKLGCLNPNPPLKWPLPP